MKTLYRALTVSMALSLLMGVLLFTGCDQLLSSANSDSTATQMNLGDLSQQEQSYLASSFADENVSGIESGLSLNYALSTGNFTGFDPSVFATMSSGNLPSLRSVATPPDTNWVGPDAEGWYAWVDSLNSAGSEYSWNYRIRWTPDIWNDANAGQKANGLEMNFTVSIDGGTLTGSMTFSGSMSATLDANGTHSSGTSQTELTFDGMDYMAAVGDVSSTVNWTDVSVAEGDYSGSMSSSMILSTTTLDGANTVPVDVNFASEFTFNQDGSGNGVGKSGDLDVAHFTFNAVTAPTERSGYYTLLDDNFQTQYPFTVSVY